MTKSAKKARAGVKAVIADPGEAGAAMARHIHGHDIVVLVRTRPERWR